VKAILALTVVEPEFWKRLALAVAKSAVLDNFEVEMVFEPVTPGAETPVPVSCNTLVAFAVRV
jgi:hypothetical protein